MVKTRRSSRLDEMRDRPAGSNGTRKRELRIVLDGLDVVERDLGRRRLTVSLDREVVDDYMVRADMNGRQLGISLNLSIVGSRLVRAEMGRRQLTILLNRLNIPLTPRLSQRRRPGYRTSDALRRRKLKQRISYSQRSSTCSIHLQIHSQIPSRRRELVVRIRPIDVDNALGGAGVPGPPNPVAVSPDSHS